MKKTCRTCKQKKYRYHLVKPIHNNCYYCIACFIDIPLVEITNQTHQQHYYKLREIVMQRRINNIHHTKGIKV